MSEPKPFLRRDVKHDVYRCYDLHGGLLYIGHTNRWSVRRCHHRRTSPSWGQVANVTFEPYPNRATAHEAEKADVQMQLGHRYLSTTLKYDRARRARADEAGNALTNALTSLM